MMPSQTIALSALALGLLVAGVAYYFWPDLYWWVYLIIFFGVAGPAYQTWLEMTANEKIIDRGDWPNKPK